jgi:hypothetical protein
MATKWISPTWRMPEESNQSKFDNYSLDFNGSSEYIDLTQHDLGINSSISCWIKPSSTAVSTNANYTIIGEDSYPFDYVLVINFFNPVLYFRVGSGYLGWDCPSIADTNWHSVALVRDSSTTAKCYLDGVDQGTPDYSSGTFSGNTKLRYLGVNYPTNSQFFPGKINELALFNYSLSETQVKYLYNNNDTVNPTVANPQNPMAIPGNAPIAYYDLGGSSTGDAGASPNTLTVPNSSVPSATVFQPLGANQTMDLGGSDLWSNILVGTNRTGIATFSFWVKGPFTSYHRQWEMGAAHHDLRRIGTTQRFYYRAGNANTYQYYEMKDTGGTDIPGVDLNSSNWIHVVLVFPAGSVIDSSGTAASGGVGDVNLFINGVECKKANTYNSGYPTAWGSGGYGIQNYNNEQLTPHSNVQIWNSVLTAGEIATLYNNGKPYLGTQPQPNNLKGWWRLNIDTSNWDGSNWTISDNSVDWKNSLGFNGNSNILISSNSSPYNPKIDASQNFSMSFWIRSTFTPSGFYSTKYFVGLVGGGVGADIIRVKQSNGGTGSGLVLNSNNNKYGLTLLNDGGWHNIVLTYDSSTGDLLYYADGAAEQIQANQGGGDMIGNYASSSTDIRMNIGAYVSTNSNPWIGQASNYTLFEGSKLTPSEISTLYNNGLPETTPSFSPTSWWKLDNTTTGVQDSIGSKNGTNNGAVASGIAVSQVNGTSSGMTTANLVNSDLERSIPYSSYSMAFDGLFDYIEFSDNDNFSFTTGSADTSFSISFWVKPGGMNQNNGIAIVKSTEYLLKTDSTGRLLVTLFDSGGNEIGINITTANWLYTPPAYLWSNVTVTYDGSSSNTGFEIYLNGQIRTDVARTSTGTYTHMTNSSNNLFWGKDGAFEYLGSASNFSLWKNKQLTQGEVIKISNGGVPNDISSLNPTGWWSFAGDSYYDGTNWIFPDLSSNSNNGTSYGMGGTELVGNGPGSTSNGVATSMNIPGNLQGNAPNSSSNAFSVNMNADDKSTSVPSIP